MISTFLRVRLSDDKNPTFLFNMKISSAGEEIEAKFAEKLTWSQVSASSMARDFNLDLSPKSLFVTTMTELFLLLFIIPVCFYSWTIVLTTFQLFGESVVAAAAAVCFLRQGLIMYLCLAGSTFCRPCRSLTHRDQAAFASQVLELEACTILWLHFNYFKRDFFKKTFLKKK